MLMGIVAEDQNRENGRQEEGTTDDLQNKTKAKKKMKLMNGGGDRDGDMKGVNEDDRISQLPDAILYHILALLPLNSAIRTSILSNRWKYVWKDFWPLTTTIDFGKEFPRALIHRQIAETIVQRINRLLHLHSSNIIDSFRLFIYPQDEYLSDIEAWIEFSIKRRVRELDLNMALLEEYFPHYFVGKYRGPPRGRIKLPPSLFTCDSLTILKLNHCDFRLPSNFDGFSALKILYLNSVHFNDDLPETMLPNFPVLEMLTLRACYLFRPLKLCSPDLKLRSLTLLKCLDLKIEISAPNLLSLTLEGRYRVFSFESGLSVKDAIITSLSVGSSYHNRNPLLILSRICHVKTLTMCEDTLFEVMSLEYYNYENGFAHGKDVLGSPITFPNLKELLLMMRSFDDRCLHALYHFFRNYNLPSLEKLFIELQLNYWMTLHYTMPIGGGPPECLFYHIKMIKINSFCGNKVEMELVKFLLEKAVVLEYMILVTPRKGINDSMRTTLKISKEAELRLLHELLSLLPKASSNARVVLCEHSEDDNSFHPTHTEVYDWINI